MGTRGIFASPLLCTQTTPWVTYWSIPFQIQGGIGRMILKEEMKARTSSYDNDPWNNARSSRSSSKETLHSMGYNYTMNGCKEATLSQRR